MTHPIVVLEVLKHPFQYQRYWNIRFNTRSIETSTLYLNAIKHSLVDREVLKQPFSKPEVLKHALVILEVLNNALVVLEVLKQQFFNIRCAEISTYNSRGIKTYTLIITGTKIYLIIFGHNRSLICLKKGTRHRPSWCYTIVILIKDFCLTNRKALRNVHSLLRTGGETLLVFLARQPVFKVYEIQSRKPEWQPYMKVRLFHLLPLCS